MTTDEIKALQKSVRTLERKLQKSERNRATVEQRRDKYQAMMLAVNQELAENKALLQDKIGELAKTLADLREAQHQLVLREKMAALGSLVAGILHEINTPLGAVRSSVSLSIRCINRVRRHLGEKLEAPLEHPQVLRSLKVLTDSQDTALTAADRLGAIVQRLKAFSGVDRGELRRVDLRDNLASTLAFLSQKLGGRIVLVTELEQIPEVPCYAHELNQAFLNLLNNAIEAIDGEGQITVRLTVVNDGARVTITDTGCGIPKADLDRIYDPGFTTKGVGVGTGLGLATAHAIVRQHHGSLTVDSEVGQGTSVALTIPFTEPRLPSLTSQTRRVK